MLCQRVTTSNVFSEFTNIHKHIARNTLGRDFFVGDIHGKYNELMAELNQQDFDFDVDRLFSVGDIIDRGEDSEKCLELLNQAWFFAVKGNHEHMLLNCLDSPEQWPFFYSVGGLWAKKWQQQPEILVKFAKLINHTMPLALSLDTQFGVVGVSHASAVKNWHTVQQGEVGVDDIETLLWKRTDYNAQLPTIENVFLTIHGHNAVEAPTKLNNQIWLDTYKMAGRLSVISLDELAILPKYKSPKRWFRR